MFNSRYKHYEYVRLQGGRKVPYSFDLCKDGIIVTIAEMVNDEEYDEFVKIMKHSRDVVEFRKTYTPGTLSRLA